MWTDSEKRDSPAPHAQLLHQRSLQNTCGHAHTWVHTQLPSSGSDPSRPLGRWQLRQCHVRGREGRPGAAGRPALRGDPAGLGAELHVRRPFPPGLQRLSCLCSWPFPPDLMAGAREPGVCSPSLRPWNSHVLGWLAPSLGLLDAFGSLCTFIVAAPGGLEGLPREGTPQGRDPVCPLTPSSSRGLPSAKEDEDEDVAALRAAPPPHRWVHCSLAAWP